MHSLIRNPKAFWSGIMFLAFGLAALYIAKDYSMGRGARMGSGYFPVVLACILSVIGVIEILMSLRRSEEGIGKFAIKEGILILASVMLFGFIMRGAGMIPSVVVLVLISAYASKQFRWKSAILLAIGSAAFCALVFVKALGLPLPLLGPWFGF